MEPKSYSDEARQALLRLTPRNLINLCVVVGACAIVAASSHGFALADLGLDPAQTRAAAIGLALGAIFPGSPVGRVLDWVASFFGGPPSPPPALADLDQIAGQLRPPPPVRPARVLPYGPTLHVALLTALSLALALTGCSLLMNGCGGASPLRTQAAIADTAGASADAACQELNSHRAHDVIVASQEEDPATASARVAAVRAHYAPLVIACNLFADAQGAWADEIQRCQAEHLAGRDCVPDEHLVQAVMSSWPDLAAALDAEGIQLDQPDNAGGAQ